MPFVVLSCHLHLHRKQEAVLVWIHTSSLFSPPTLVCFSIPSPIFLKTTLPNCASTVPHRHKHHLLSWSSRNVTAREAKVSLNHSLLRNAPRPFSTRCVCLCWGRTAKHRALGLGLHRMNNFPLKVTHFLFSVFRQSGPMGRV